jgi:hypothetical protein
MVDWSFTEFCWGDHFKEDDVGGAYSMHRRDEKYLQNSDLKA